MTDSCNTATGELGVFQMNKSICIIYLHRWVTKDKHCLTAIILKPGQVAQWFSSLAAMAMLSARTQVRVQLEIGADKVQSQQKLQCSYSLFKLHMF